MKNLKYLFLLAVVAFSCSDDDEKSDNTDGCKLLGLTETHSAAANNPCAIAVSPAGYIAISEYNGGYGTLAKIRIYTSYDNFKNGTVKTELTAVSPEAMVFDSDNNLYVSETEQIAGIKVFDHIGDGAFTHKKTIQDNFNNPRGLAFDAQGRLYMANDGTGQIFKFDDPFNSNAYVPIGSWLTGIKGLAINGNIMYVANYITNVVTRNILKSDGTLERIDDSLTLAKATDISVNGNTIVVTSHDNSTITVFSNCDFSDENKSNYSDKGKIFGTAFLNSGSILAADFGLDKAKTFNLQ